MEDRVNEYANYIIKQEVLTVKNKKVIKQTYIDKETKEKTIRFFTSTYKNAKGYISLDEALKAMEISEAQKLSANRLYQKGLSIQEIAYRTGIEIQSLQVMFTTSSYIDVKGNVIIQ